MTSGIAAAVGEMAQMRELELMRRQPRERLSQAINAIDGLLDSLERLNLGGRSQVPEGTELQMNLVLRLIPLELRPSSRLRPVRELIDDLYRVQERLLAQRCRPEWLELRNSEDEGLVDSA